MHLPILATFSDLLAWSALEEKRLAKFGSNMDVYAQNGQH
jgi:hypothetical protein